MGKAIGWAAAALLLAGCGGQEGAENVATPTPTPTPGPRLAGVALDKPVRVAGGGWTIDIAPGRLTYRANATAAPVELYPHDPAVDATAARWTTQTTAGEPVTIVLTDVACKGAPLTAAVTIGARKLSGCAQPR